MAPQKKSINQTKVSESVPPVSDVKETIQATTASNKKQNTPAVAAPVVEKVNKKAAKKVVAPVDPVVDTLTPAVPPMEQTAGKAKGKAAVKAAGKTSEKAPVKAAGKAPVKAAGKAAGKAPGKAAGKAPVKAAGKAGKKIETMPSDEALLLEDAVDADAVDADEDTKTRSFKVQLPGDQEYVGRFTGLTPYQAANKALSKYYRSLETVDILDKSQIEFAIKESTRGSKRLTYTYKGNRIKLETPISYTIKSLTGEERVITKQFKNQLIKVKKTPIKVQIAVV